jgi:hypothetical protein
MLSVRWALLATKVEKLPPAGLIITSPFEDGSFSSFPAEAPVFFCVARLVGGKDGETHKVAAPIIDSKGVIIQADLGDRMRVTGNFIVLVRGYEGIVFPSDDAYAVDIRVDSESVYKCPLLIKRK